MASQTLPFQTIDNPQMPGVKDVEPQVLWDNRQTVAIIDVRRPDEFTAELGHIPGAELIVLDTLPQRLVDISKDKPVVFICRSGGRSARAVEFAMSEGWTNVFNLRGGMMLWNELGLQVEGRNEN